MHHKLLTQRALFCIGVNAKKGHAESAFCDACRTSSGVQVPGWSGCVTGAGQGLCHRCQAGVGVSQVPSWCGCVTGTKLG